MLELLRAGDMALLVGICLPFVKAQATPQHHINSVWWYKPELPVLRRQRQEDQKFKII